MVIGWIETIHLSPFDSNSTSLTNVPVPPGRRPVSYVGSGLGSFTVGVILARTPPPITHHPSTVTYLNSIPDVPDRPGLGVAPTPSGPTILEHTT